MNKEAIFGTYKRDHISSENTVYQNIRTVLVTARQKVYSAINSAMVEAYWEIGRQIMEAQEGQRAEYGTGLIKYLAERLTNEFGKGFTQTNLKYMRQFYLKECIESNWSVRQLERQITSFYYIDLVFYNYMDSVLVLVSMVNDTFLFSDIYNRLNGAII